MLFLLITFIAIGLYFWNYKVPALLIFFFCLTQGFDLITQDEATSKLFLGFAWENYALLFLFSVIAIDIICIRNYLKIDRFVVYLILFFSFLVVAIVYSKYSVSLGWKDIFLACRYLLFLPIYFLFRNISKSQLELLLKCLFNVTVFISFLYLLQILFDEFILVGHTRATAQFLGITFPRYYNHPSMLYFFVFLSIYKNPHQGFFKYLTSTVLICALLGAFHRNHTSFFFISIIIGIVISMPKIRRIQIGTISLSLLLLGSSFLVYKLKDSRTFKDLNVIISGDVIDIAETGFDFDDESTFTFRIAHLLERNQYLLENPQSMLLGAGLIPGNSDQIENLFDFKIGLISELTGEVDQVQTSDISYSVLILQLGYLGTFLYLLLLIYLAVFFYKHKNNKYALFSFLYLIFSFGTSFFSANLLHPITYIMPLITYNIVKKTIKEDNLKDSNE